MTDDRKHRLGAAPRGQSGSVHRRYDDFTWENVAIHPYKDDGSAPFRDVTRQILFSGPDHASDLRYFEVAAGGYSTLERHEHVHGVMILRGRGQALVGADIHDLAPFDLITVPPMTWHQFRASRGEPLGFLCLVNAERDKPQLPTEAERAELELLPGIRAFFAGK
jgi:mannose-6-phosphate isomerase-like protein (cupin superfamily)